MEIQTPQKSAILNSEFGQVLFESGVSIGTGKTQVLQCKEKGGNKYCDTPGLDDKVKKEQAGAEITKLLRQGDEITLAFVATLTAGRIKPADAMTIDLVLESLQIDVNNKYTVIINQVTDAVFNELKADDFAFNSFKKMFNNKFSTDSFKFIPFDGSAHDAKDIANLNINSLEGFKTMPTLKIVKDKVKEIFSTQHDDFEPSYEVQLTQKQKELDEEKAKPRVIHKRYRESGFFEDLGKGLGSAFARVAVGGL